ncbi:very long chain fatty acid elongase 7 [Leptinotarsa decemlineata]|uniref:very long chain fatty acid elongase 7 n=1 Tax=Leptinotarsa decemlineata TaxID=7539 RepID=UPI000C25260C|nr:elongation of very long chain fatty acids protein 7-like [Leptinotarsa decemlineata]
MALLLKKIYLGYFWLFEDIADPRPMEMGLFLMSSPFEPGILVGLYLYFVLKLGPELMKNRKPFDLRNVIIIYNAIQIVINTYVAYEAFIEIYFYSNWDCSPIDYSHSPRNKYVVRMYHLFFLIKVVDLIDTVFFVLRKKQQQVTFLHIYHHFGMVLILWICTKFYAGGHGTWTGLINSTVHSIMYTYYLLAALDEKWKKSLSLKKFITLMQMAQFLSFIIIYGRLLLKPSCKYPKLISFFFVPQNFFMLLLFADFYRRAYFSKKKN